MKFKAIEKNGNILSFSFNGKDYKDDDAFIAPFDFIETEHEGVIALTNSGICKILSKEGFSILATILNNTVKVSLQSCERTVDILMGLSSMEERNGSPETTQDVAVNKAFRSYFGIPSTRIFVATGEFVPSGKSKKTSNSPAPAQNNSSQNTSTSTGQTVSTNQNSASTSKADEVTINFGTHKGEKVYDILSSEEGIRYFSVLLTKNAVAQGNASFRNAYISFFQKNPPTTEEAKDLFNKTCEVLKENGYLN